MRILINVFKKWEHIVFLISGIALIAITALGYFLLQPQLVKQGTNSKTQSQIQANNSEKGEETYQSEAYGFSVEIPEGWTYKTPDEKIGSTILVINLSNNTSNIDIPIFIDEKDWELVKSEVQKNFLPEAVSETTLAGQPSLKIVSTKKEINPGYNFRIKHPKRDNLVLLGTASYIGGQNIDLFHKSVESVLNSIKFD